MYYPHAENQGQAGYLVNGASFEPPTVPVLLQILSGVKNASDLVPKGSIYPLEPNKSVELTIPGGVVGGPVSIPYQNPATRPHHFELWICMIRLHSTQFTYMAMRSP